MYLDPHEFHSTWLGNKAVYRTRMALADGAELIILAPAVREFGEDKTHRWVDSQVWISRDAGDAGGGGSECRSGGGTGCGGASDSLVVGGPVQDYVVPGATEPRGD